MMKKKAGIQQQGLSIKWIWFLICVLLFSIRGFAQSSFSRAEYLHGKLTPLRSSFDVTYQDITVKVEPKRKFITVSNAIQFTVIKDISTIQLDLFSIMHIDSIRFEGKELSFTRDSNAFFVSFPYKLLKGTSYSICVAASGNPIVAKKAPWDGGFVWGKDVNQVDWVGMACEGLGASSWLPCKDHWSDEADSVDVHLIVPNTLMGVSNGHYMGYHDVDSRFTEYNWSVKNPINNYNIAINMANYVHIADTFPHKLSSKLQPLSLDYYVLQYNKNKAVEQFKQTAKMLEAFEHYFGPYPFAQDGFKLVETPYWGMEHQSCVAYGNNYENNEWGFDFILVHESGHEWFGNNITAQDPADMWIHESFTTYSESLYIEYWQNAEEARKYLLMQQAKIANNDPMVGPYNVHFHGRSNNDIYYKGAWMLHSLRNSIDNDTLWFNALREFSLTFAKQTITTEHVIAFFSKRIGKDLVPFFKQYLYQPSLPIFEYKILKRQDGRLVMSYRWKNASKHFEMPIKVTVTKGNFETITPRKKWQLIDLNYFDEKDFKILENRYLMKIEQSVATEL
jgi:aminopeptidase N